MTIYPHLSEAAQKAMELSVPDRLNYIGRERFILYDRAREIDEQFERLLTHPPRPRMPHLMLVGESTNGKSAIAQRFASRHRSRVVARETRSQFPVILIRLPPNPKETRFYDQILRAIGAPFSEGANPGKKMGQLLRILPLIETRLLIIDEIQTLLRSRRDVRAGVLDAIKYLAETLMIGVILVGTPEAQRAVYADPHSAHRFPSLELPTWECDQFFRAVLLAFEQSLPLARPSNLASRPLAMALYERSHGLLGELARLLELAAAIAVETQREAIDLKIIEMVDRRWTG